MADDKATVEEALDVKVEEPAEQKVVESTEKETEKTELSDKEKHTIEIGAIRDEMAKLKEKGIRADAEKELLKSQLESEVLNKIKPEAPKETVVDDGFKALTDGELDELSMSQVRKYLKEETAHDKRLEDAKTEATTKHAEATDPIR